MIDIDDLIRRINIRESLFVGSMADLSNISDEFKSMQSKLQAAESKLNEMAQIEPVGFIDANGDAILSVDGLKGGMLYRGPVAQSNADKVEIDKEPVYMWQLQNEEGWIECSKEWFNAHKSDYKTRIVYNK